MPKLDPLLASLLARAPWMNFMQLCRLLMSDRRILMPIRLAVPTLASVLLLSACGMWQSVKDTTVDATRAVFVAKVKQMNLVIESRAALNPNEQGQSLPVVMHVYQLKDARAFERAGYAQLLGNERALPKADLLGRMEATLEPGAMIKLSAPMAGDAQYVGVVAFFRNQSNAEWQVLIPKSLWRNTDPVKLVVTDNRMELAQ
ncbi:type VI secretion system lipoprotein TssJ [Burkholderia ubonensis]|uniref:type VI secretion system lipoprotein TssJ n=1 Tax=Burkholderia ubonensis TaxID=101571 RepID=UPI001E45CA47|nr:type VI secretion system lipoprotein TssJ [Burkholderia ubonensis]